MKGNGLEIVLLIFMLMFSVFSAVALAIQQWIETITCTGQITSVGVKFYSDASAIQQITAINWGVVQPSTTTNKVYYMKNTGNVPENVTMTVTGWNPSNANQYISCTWNMTQGQSIVLNRIYPVKFSLIVNQNTDTITAFGFNIVVVGEG